MRETNYNFLNFPLPVHTVDTWTHLFSFSFTIKATPSYLGKKYNLWYLNSCQPNEINFQNAVTANRTHPPATSPCLVSGGLIIITHILMSVLSHTHMLYSISATWSSLYLSCGDQLLGSFTNSDQLIICVISYLIFAWPLNTLGRNQFYFVNFLSTLSHICLTLGIQQIFFVNK